jgi:hypothetical protein
MPKPKQKKSSPARPGAPDEAAKAFVLIEPELDGVSEVLQVNVDIPRAVSVAVGAVPHLLELRSRFVEELPKHPIHLLDKLMTVASAAYRVIVTARLCLQHWRLIRPSRLNPSMTGAFRRILRFLLIRPILSRGRWAICSTACIVSSTTRSIAMTSRIATCPSGNPIQQPASGSKK